MAIHFTTRARGQADPNAIDVSSYGKDGWNVLSPKYPHGGIPVPGMPGTTAQTVEGIWQGLKDFDDRGMDIPMLQSKKPSKRRGRPIGHKWMETGEHLGLVESRLKIYIPAYRWMIASCPKALVKFNELVELARTGDVTVYDFDANDNIHVNKPYAHAALLKVMVEEVLNQDATRS
jgi:hypothetical protein